MHVSQEAGTSNTAVYQFRQYTPQELKTREAWKIETLQRFATKWKATERADNATVMSKEEYDKKILIVSPHSTFMLVYVF